MVRYLIVEDERFAYEELQRMMVRLRPDYELAGWTTGVEQTVLFLRANAVDVVLMDVRLTDGNCFEVFEQLSLSVPIIFVTAYDEYALQAFKVNSVDYLLKPVEEKELQAALDKFDRNALPGIQSEEVRSLGSSLLAGCRKNRFLVQSGNTYGYVETGQVAFFYSEDKRVLLHTLQGKRYVVNYTLEQLETMLDERAFFRVSRNCMAQLCTISRVSRYFNGRLKVSFEPACPQEVLVSRTRVPAFLQWLDGK
jgi:two-component system response regulator LytT